MDYSNLVARKGLGLVAQAILLTTLLLTGAFPVQAQSGRPDWYTKVRSKLMQELSSQYGDAQRPALERGLDQAASFWRPEDGDAATFEDFARANYAGEPAARDSMFARFERLLEALDGHMNEIGREFREQADLDRGPILPFDETFAAYSPSAHVTDDFFQNKLAFVVLLNFPLTTLEQRVTEGEKWTRRQWAETRLAHRFSKRIPAAVNLEIESLGLPKPIYDYVNEVAGGYLGTDDRDPVLDAFAARLGFENNDETCRLTEVVQHSIQ